MSRAVFLFLLRRILEAIPVLLALSLVTFLIIKSPPGDYADGLRTMLINQGGASAAEADAQAALYRAQNGLNDPLLVQYGRWLWGIVSRFDFGMSMASNRPVADIVWERLPATIALALVCHMLASAIGVGLGILAATNAGTWADRLINVIAFLGMTTPRFLLALVMLYVLIFHFDVTQIGSFQSAAFAGAPWSLAKLGDLLGHVWPVIVIATWGGLAYNVRVMRGNLLDVLGAQYIETARAKGLPAHRVVLRHAVPNAVHPLIAYQGVALPYMMTGEIEVAIVFGLATVGPAIVGAMAVGDVFVAATFMLVLAATLILGNILADLALVLVDPRLRLGSEA
ncbi:ABC transporter permease [Porphyrobacter sp. TH134]|uniref:ABC transporter permease n=1 Tax=Porphyrobacter sp. TH134 TaxID=2067450 RepID=UPI000C7ACE93|nr:ABC transporter permease [Porphyrobacter sp. TH134]PLK23967.1 ABC transporter permease [Porphyrobacter sp. TH134]